MLRTRLPLPRFVSAGEIFVGPGSIAALRALQASRATLLIGPSMARDSAVVERLTKAVGALAVRVVIVPSGEPSMSTLREPLAQVSAFSPDWIVAVGGGSLLDAGKAIWALYEHPDLDLELVTRPFALPHMRGRCRFAAVPTTAGTGSEVSSAAVLSDPATGRKRFIVSHELLPDVVVLDPRLMDGVPHDVMVSAALDALAHAVEGYVSIVPNALADAFARDAIATLFRELSLGIPGEEAQERRLSLMNAALLAGWVQNQRPPGIGHAVAHQLGRYGARHGLACGVLLPAAMRVNSRDTKCDTRYAELATHLGLGASSENLVSRVEGVLDTLGVPRTLAAAIPATRPALGNERAQIIADARLDVCARTNPIPLDDALVNDLLERVA